MTKAVLKEKYSEWNRNISALDDRQMEIFHALQDLCAEKGDGHRWCGLKTLLEEIVKAGDEKATFRACNLYREYCKIDGKLEALRDFAIATNNFEI